VTAFENARYLLSEADPAKLGPCAAEAAFVGRSNVGKSSLINALLGRPLAKVSQTPGRTRTINVFEITGGRWVVDLPGYGFARGPETERAAWRGMIEGYLTSRPSLREVFVLVDAEVGPTPLDVQMLEWLRAEGLPARPVATKADKVKPSRSVLRRREVAASLGVLPEGLAWVSTAKDVGVRELRRELAELLRGGKR
jgi:GTP-binding protein